MLGVAGVVINYVAQDRRLEQEAIQARHEIQLANLEQERMFLDTFVTHAISEDLQARIRLAHYVKSTATNPVLVMKWTEFYEELVEECQRFSEEPIACGVGGLERLR